MKKGLDIFVIILSVSVLAGFIISVAYPNFGRRNIDLASINVTLGCLISIIIANNIVDYKLKKILITMLFTLSILITNIFVISDFSAAGWGTPISLATQAYIGVSHLYKFRNNNEEATNSDEKNNPEEL